MNSLKPGLSIRVVTDVDQMEERASVTASTIYEATDERLIIAQTEPPIRLHQQIMITYLTREKGYLERCGFLAEAVELIDYDGNEKRGARAIVAEKRGEPRPFSVRMSYRVEPTSENRLEMYISGRKVGILDISLGGAQFSYAPEIQLPAGVVVEVGLDIGGRSYDFEARIIRTWESTDIRLRREVVFGSVEFLNMGRTAEQALLRKIQQIERKARLTEDGQ
jgi:hypothetical protein